MSTTLSFEAPADLSVGSVRIKGENGVLHEWTATPNDRRFHTVDVAPGFYLAEITPAGLSSRTFLFEVKRDRDNDVVAPAFSALTASGIPLLSLDIEDGATAYQALGRLQGRHLDEERRSEGAVRVINATRQTWNAGTAKRRLTVALAEENASGTESWRPFRGTMSSQFSESTLTLVVAQPDAADAAHRRIRLSLAVEDVRVERLLLPMYRNGTRITLTPSPLTTFDLSLQVMPEDSELRALARLLAAGTSSEAVAVRDGVLGGRHDRFLDGPAADPWGALLTGLLTIRFPEVFGPLGQGWIDRLLKQAPWAYDSHVLSARRILNAAGETQKAQIAAAVAALSALAKAQTLGSPYYSYSNRLIGEMLDALCAFPGLDDAPKANMEKALARWRRDNPLQASAGAAFTWRRRDLRRLKDEQVLAPDRRTSGVLSSRHGTIAFQGYLGGGSINLESARPTAPKAALARPDVRALTEPSSVNSTRELEEIPALKRPAGPANDPNKGRFGGEARNGGYTLHARFHPIRSEQWTKFDLIVEADKDPGPGAEALFCLHPTYRPQWVSVRFHNRRASIPVKAWGGFTVGVWLAGERIELECDLAKLSDAPQIIREL